MEEPKGYGVGSTGVVVVMIPLVFHVGGGGGGGEGRLGSLEGVTQSKGPPSLWCVFHRIPSEAFVLVVLFRRQVSFATTPRHSSGTGGGEREGNVVGNVVPRDDVPESGGVKEMKKGVNTGRVPATPPHPIRWRDGLPSDPSLRKRRSRPTPPSPPLVRCFFSSSSFHGHAEVTAAAAAPPLLAAKKVKDSGRRFLDFHHHTGFSSSSVDRMGDEPEKREETNGKDLDTAEEAPGGGSEEEEETKGGGGGGEAFRRRQEGPGLRGGCVVSVWEVSQRGDTPPLEEEIDAKDDGSNGCFDVLSGVQVEAKEIQGEDEPLHG